MVFPAFQDQMACRECLVSQGRKVLRVEKELKDRLVIRVNREFWVPREKEVMKDLAGRAGYQE